MKLSNYLERDSHPEVIVAHFGLAGQTANEWERKSNGKVKALNISDAHYPLWVVVGVNGTVSADYIRYIMDMDMSRIGPGESLGTYDYDELVELFQE